MKIRCNHNSGRSLTSKYIVIGDTPDTVFHVRVGKEYRVYAISSYRGAPFYLLNDDNDLPNWYPVDLFSIVDNEVPQGWRCMTFTNDDGLEFLIGYERLIADESHYDGILDRDERAMQAFRAEVQRSRATESIG